ncbi:MAG: hypothetical protein NXI31_26075 [bacterium]|nr:hypothetical protein [bacterium]
MAIPTLLHRDTVAFVMPGLVHRLGNLLFTLQGAAQFDDRPVDHAVVRKATARGGAVLVVARTLLGPAPEPPAPAGELLAVIADLVRLPLRDAGHAFVLQVADADTAGAGVELVDPAAFCPAVLTAIRLIGAAVPAGQTGNLAARLERVGHEVRVGVGYAGAVGELPFPLALDGLAGDWTAAMGQTPPGTTVSTTAGELRLAFALRGLRAGDATGQA